MIEKTPKRKYTKSAVIERKEVAKRKKAEKECYSEANRSKLTILAIDPSYQECGFSLFQEGELILIERLNFEFIQKKNELKGEMSKKEKRKRLKRVIELFTMAFSVDVVVTERARLYSQGFINIDVIAALSELICVIIDTVDCPVVSINTQTWRFHTSGDRFHKKADTIKWVLEKMITDGVCYARDRELTDNECDAVGIGKAFYNGAKSEIER